MVYGELEVLFCSKVSTVNSLNTSKFLEEKNELRTTVLLIAITGFSQGMTGLADLAINYHFKEGLLLSPAKYSFYNSLIFAPWFIKPLWGYISDSLPIFGYRRKSYLLFSSITQSFLWLLLSSNIPMTLHQTVFILGCIQVCICICNVIAEALMVEISRKFSEQENVSEEEKFNTIFIQARRGHQECLPLLRHQEFRHPHYGLLQWASA